MSIPSIFKVKLGIYSGKHCNKTWRDPAAHSGGEQLDGVQQPTGGPGRRYQRCGQQGVFALTEFYSFQGYILCISIIPLPPFDIHFFLPDE